MCLVAITVFSLAFVGLRFSGTSNIIPDPVPQQNRNYNTLNVKVLNIAQTNANDNYIPYRQAQFFINRSDPAKDSFIGEWGVHFFQRTPLLGAVTAQYFNAFKDKPPVDYTWAAGVTDTDNTYEKFQIISTILNSLFIIPAFYIIKRLFDLKSAKVALLFMVPSQFFFYNSIFSWPKSLVAFFILLSWLLILEEKTRYTLLAGFAAGMAYLTHDLAVIYIAATILLLLYKKRYKDIFVYPLFIFIFMIPWLIISSIIYKKTSSFIYYPISIRDIPQANEHAQIWREFINTSPFRIIAIRLESIFYLFSPYQLIYSEGGQSIFRRIWALSIFSIPGAIGLGLIIPATVGFINKIKDISMWIYIVVPVVLVTLLIGWPRGLGALHFAQPIIVVLTGLASWQLLKFKRPIWILLAYLMNIIQLTIFILFSYESMIKPWISSTLDIIRSISILLIIVIIGLLINSIARNKKNQLLNFFGI